MPNRIILELDVSRESLRDPFVWDERVLRLERLESWIKICNLEEALFFAVKTGYKPSASNQQSALATGGPGFDLQDRSVPNATRTSHWVISDAWTTPGNITWRHFFSTSTSFLTYFSVGGRHLNARNCHTQTRAIPFIFEGTRSLHLEWGQLVPMAMQR